MAKPRQRTRPQRWGDLVAAAQEKLTDARDALGELESVFSELRDLQGEYQDWFDNLSEGLQQGATGEKLEAIQELDLEPDFDVLGDIDQVIGEAEAIELPLGFGRD